MGSPGVAVIKSSLLRGLWVPKGRDSSHSARLHSSCSCKPEVTFLVSAKMLRVWRLTNGNRICPKISPNNLFSCKYGHFAHSLNTRSAHVLLLGQSHASKHTTCSRAAHGHGAFPARDPAVPSTGVGFALCKSRLQLLLYLQHQPIRWDGQGLLPWEHSATKLGGAEEIRMRRGTWEAHGELCSVSWLWMKVLEHRSTGRGQEESPGLGNSHGAETLEEKGI